MKKITTVNNLWSEKTCFKGSDSRWNLINEKWLALSQCDWWNSFWSEFLKCILSSIRLYVYVSCNLLFTFFFLFYQCHWHWNQFYVILLEPKATLTTINIFPTCLIYHREMDLKYIKFKNAFIFLAFIYIAKSYKKVT